MQFNDEESWLQARCGIPTASRFSDACARLKNGEFAQAAKDYAFELVAERLTYTPSECYQTEAMTWGKECERLAIQEFNERFKGSPKMIQTPYHFHTKQLKEGCIVGCTPDAISECGNFILEVKCPTTTTHLKNYQLMYQGTIPDKYVHQVSGQQLITGKSAWFVSYDPRLPETSSFSAVLDLQFDAEEISAKLIEFCEYVNRLEQELK